jgi:hypothetical protein
MAHIDGSHGESFGVDLTDQERYQKLTPWAVIVVRTGQEVYIAGLRLPLRTHLPCILAVPSPA